MNCKIILVASFEVFGELAEAMAYSLRERGHNVEIVDDSKIRGYGDLNIVIKALRSFDHHRIPGIRVLYQPEELWNRRERGIYDLSDGWKRVLELYPENVKIPRGTKNVVFCPIGYSPAFEFDLPKPDVQDIDLYFHGSMTDRRKDIASEIEKFGYNFVCSSNEFGEARNLKILRSKIILNIKAHDLWSYGPLHVIMAQCNKRLVMCEKTGIGYGPFVPGKHFIEWESIVDLKEKVRYYIDNEEIRLNFVESVYDDIKKNISFDSYFMNGLKGLL